MMPSLPPILNATMECRRSPPAAENACRNMPDEESGLFDTKTIKPGARAGPSKAARPTAKFARAVSGKPSVRRPWWRVPAWCPAQCGRHRLGRPPQCCRARERLQAEVMAVMRTATTNMPSRCGSPVLRRPSQACSPSLAGHGIVVGLATLRLPGSPRQRVKAPAADTALDPNRALQLRRRCQASEWFPAALQIGFRSGL